MPPKRNIVRATDWWSVVTMSPGISLSGDNVASYQSVCMSTGFEFVLL